MRAGLVESYGRSSVVASTQAQCPPQSRLERLFRATQFDANQEFTEADKKENKFRQEWETKIDAVTGNKTWDSFTPASRQE